MKPGAESLVRERTAERGIRGEPDHRHAGHLAEERHRPAGSGIDLQDVRDPIADDELDVDQPNGVDQAGDQGGRIDDASRLIRGQRDGRIDRKRVARVNPGPFDVLEDAGNQNRIPIADRIDIELAPQQVLVDQDRPPDAEIDGGFHVAPQVFRRTDDLHAAPPEDIRGSHQHRVADPGGNLHRVGDAGRGTAGRLWDPVLAEQPLTTAAIFGEIDGIDRRSQDADPARGEGVRQVQPGLAAELDHHPEHGIPAEDVAHAFQIERFEIEAGRGVEVGADGFRIAIDEHAVEAGLLQGGRGVHAAVVELDALADADRAGANDGDGAVAAANDLVLVFVGGVVIGGHGLELGGAGIDLAEGRLDGGHWRPPATQFGDPSIVEPRSLRAAQDIGGGGSRELGLQPGDEGEAVDEPCRVAGGDDHLVLWHPIA